MGILADAVMEAGGEVIGVIPDRLFPKEIPHMGLTELHMVKSMHERKQVMADLSDGFMAMPGGVGTLEELTEIYTWSQLGCTASPAGCSTVEGYYDYLTRFLDHAVHERFLKPIHRDTLMVGKTPGAAGRVREYRAPRLGKWLDSASS